ncbi:MAG: OmpH family outer membrane protein [Methylococcales bacterium]|nr:OmpH family outer membrane protein [Methylococcales bacterium]
MKKKIALFLGLLFTANIAYADLKIGVINMSAVLEKTPQMEKAKKRFDTKFGVRGKQLEIQGKDIQALEEKINKDASTMSESVKNNLVKDYQNKVRDFKKAQQELNEDTNVYRNEELGKIQRSIIEVANGIAKDGDYDLLLQSDVVVYKKDQFDITEQVVKKLSTMPE